MQSSIPTLLFSTGCLKPGKVIKMIQGQEEKKKSQSMRNIKSSVCLTCQKRLRGDDYAAEEPFSESTRQPSWCRRTLKT